MSVFYWYNYCGDNMKKYFLLILLLLLLCACNDKSKTIIEENKEIVKVDENKDYIYLDSFNVYNLSEDNSFIQQLPIVNFNTEDAKKVNLELKSRIAINDKKAVISDGIVNKVLLDEFELLNNDKYISLVVKEYYYLNQEKNISDIMTYVFEKKSMKLLNNEDVLDIYNYSNDDLYDKLSLLLADDLYYLMMIKNSDYKLYIDENDNLVLLSIINSDDESELKKVVITE